MLMIKQSSSQCLRNASNDTYVGIVDLNVKRRFLDQFFILARNILRAIDVFCATRYLFHCCAVYSPPSALNAR